GDDDSPGSINSHTETKVITRTDGRDDFAARAERAVEGAVRVVSRQREVVIAAVVTIPGDDEPVGGVNDYTLSVVVSRPEGGGDLPANAEERIEPTRSRCPAVLQLLQRKAGTRQSAQCGVLRVTKRSDQLAKGATGHVLAPYEGNYPRKPSASSPRSRRAR